MKKKVKRIARRFSSAGLVCFFFLLFLTTRRKAVFFLFSSSNLRAPIKTHTHTHTHTHTPNESQWGFTLAHRFPATSGRCRIVATRFFAAVILLFWFVFVFLRWRPPADVFLVDVAKSMASFAHFDGQPKFIARRPLVGHGTTIEKKRDPNDLFFYFFGKKKNPPSTRDSMKETPEPTHLYRETHWGGHEKRRKRKNRYVPGRSKNTSFFFVRKRGKRNNPEPEPNDDEEEFQKRKKKETAATDLQRPIDAPGRLFSVPKRGRSFLFFLYFFFGTLPVPSNLMPFRP